MCGGRAASANARTSRSRPSRSPREKRAIRGLSQSNTPTNERHDYFRTRRGVAGDVAGERLDVIHDLRCPLGRRRAADAAARRQPHAGGAAGERPHKQIARRRQQIKAGPVDVGQFVIDEGGEVGGARYKVVFTGQQLARLTLEQIVIGLRQGEYGLGL